MKIAYESERLLSQGESLNSIAETYQALGNLTEAESYFEQALSVRNETTDRIGQGVTLNSIGQLLVTQGRLAEALEYFQQALNMRREVGDIIGEIVTLGSIGTVYTTQGRYDTALHFFEEALAKAEDIDNRLNEAKMLNSIGLVYRHQGRIDAAVSYFKRYLSIAQELGSRPDEGVAMHQLASTAVTQGRFEEAHENFRIALSIAEEIDDRGLKNVVLNGIGSTYSAQGNQEKAIEYFRQALSISQESDDVSQEVVDLNNLAASHSELHELQISSDYYQQAMDALEELRAFAGDEQGRSSFVAEYAFLFSRAAAVAHRNGNDTEAFIIIERGRARAFLDSLATGTVELSDETSKTLFGQEREAYAAQQSAQDALIRAKALPEPNQKLITELEAQLQRAETTYAEVQAQLTARGDQLESLVSARKDAVLSLEEVQATLAVGTSLVSYVIGDKDGLAFVVTRNSLRAIELRVGRDTLATQMAGLHQFNTVTETTTLSSKFFNQLIAPLQLDSSTKRLLIIPHGVLHYLPFAALTPDGKRFLGDDFTISTLPAASVLRYVQEPITGGVTLPGVVAMANAEGPPQVEGVEEAARYIGQLFGAEPLLGAQATVANLQAVDDGARVLHIGAHGSFDLSVPLDSYIQLTPTGADDDGRLTVGEVYGLNLKQADLVVLSACETQVNQLSNPRSPLAVTAGDDLVGMQRAFFFAGAQNVVTTLWQVPDEPSRLLMERFYTHIRDGLAPADALQRAQQQVRAQYPNPRDWAGFVLSGVGATPLVEPLRWWQQVPWWGWALGGGMLVGLAVAGTLWRRRQTTAP